MNKLQDFRVLQKKNEKKALFSFLLYQLCLVLLTVYLFFFTSFFDRAALRLLPLALFLLGIPLTKIHLFLRPREFRGKVIYLNVGIELRKKIGFTYLADKVKVMLLVTENHKGKRISVTVPYRKDYAQRKAGDTVTLFRFLDIVYFE